MATPPGTAGTATWPARADAGAQDAASAVASYATMGLGSPAAGGVPTRSSRQQNVTGSPSLHARDALVYSWRPKITLSLPNPCMGMPPSDFLPQ